MNTFQKIHPSVTSLYFFVVLAVTMFTSNPILILISLIASVFLYCCLFGVGSFFAIIKGLALVLVLCTLFNPLFSQNGETVIFELWKIKITFQSLLFGLSVGITLACSILWFLCLSKVMTSRKILYLFGKRLPKVALTLSLSLRLIPDFLKKFKSTAQSQKALGLFNHDTLKSRLTSSRDIFLSVCAEVLEESAQISDSMRARGYGIKGYSSYREFQFLTRDAFYFVLITVYTFGIILCMVFGEIDFYYYPILSSLPLDLSDIICYILFFLLAFFPVILDIKEEVFWKYSV